MKLIFLIAILIPMFSKADTKIDITNNSNGKKYSGSFKTLNDANAWKAENLANNSWGNFTDLTIVISDITAEVQAKETQKLLDDARIEELKVKDKDTMKLDELIELLKLKGVI